MDEEFKKNVLTHLDLHDATLVSVDTRLSTLETNLHLNNENTQFLVDFVKDGAGGLRFLHRLGKVVISVVKYFGILAGACAFPYLAYYWITHDYTFPIWFQKVLEMWK